MLGAEDVDDELEDAAAEELEEAAAELKTVEAVSAVEVAAAAEVVEVMLVVKEGGVGEDDVSVKITVGTEAVDAKPSVVAEMMLSIAEDAVPTTLVATSEAVESAL